MARVFAVSNAPEKGNLENGQGPTLIIDCNNSNLKFQPNNFVYLLFGLGSLAPNQVRWVGKIFIPVRKKTKKTFIKATRNVTSGQVFPLQPFDE